MKEPDIDLLNDMRRLSAALPKQAGPEVEWALRTAFRRKHGVKPGNQFPKWLYWSAAAVVVLGAALYWNLRPAALPPVRVIYEAPGFIALPYSQSGVPMEQAVVVRVRLLPSQFVAMGVPVPASSSSAVSADILMGQDGVPRAVHFVQ